jgi:DNA-binding transcriptional regulator YiaG
MRAVETLVAEVRAAQLPSPTKRRRIRERAGVSLAQAGEVLGVDGMTVLRWERSETKPARAHAAAYRHLLEELEKAVG